MRSRFGQHWRLHPLWTGTSCLLVFGLGVFWILSGGETPVGVLLLIVASLLVPGAFAMAAIRRRLSGDPRPFLEQPVFRFQSLIYAIAAVAFVAVGFWSRRVGGEAVVSEIGGFFFGGFLTAGALLTGFAQAARRRASKQGDQARSRSV